MSTGELKSFCETATVAIVAPDAAALAAFVVALAVDATTVFAIAVALVVDCCVPSPPEEDHVSLLPRGRFRHGPRCSVLFALALSVALVVGIIIALTNGIAFVDCCEHFVVYPHPSSPEASTPQASLVVERFVSIPYDYADKTIIAIHQNAVTASKIGLM